MEHPTTKSSEQTFGESFVSKCDTASYYGSVDKKSQGWLSSLGNGTETSSRSIPLLKQQPAGCIRKVTSILLLALFAVSGFSFYKYSGLQNDTLASVYKPNMESLSPPSGNLKTSLLLEEKLQQSELLVYELEEKLMSCFTDEGGKDQNLISLNRPCTQSSDCPSSVCGTSYPGAPYPCSNAVDGKLGTYSHTNKLPSASWWHVELPDGSTVDEVVLVGAAENNPGMMARYHDFSVILRDEGLQEVARIHHPGLMQISSKKFRFFGAKAKYVEVRMERSEYMHWGEVMVFGRSNRQTCDTCVMDFYS